MDLNLSSLGSLALAAPCYVFYAKGIKFTEGLTRMAWFLLVLWFDITHTGHIGTNKLTRTYKYISTPHVMCTQQLPLLRQMNDLRIQNLLYRVLQCIFYSNCSLVQVIYLLIRFNKTFSELQRILIKMVLKAKRINHTQREREL